MNKKLRRTVNIALRKLNEADIAIQSISNHLTFSRFNGNTPNVTVCNSSEVILEYQGLEMSIDEAIERMEEYGYITPDDFS